jgi:hypothetical protein
MSLTEVGENRETSSGVQKVFEGPLKQAAEEFIDQARAF